MTEQTPEVAAFAAILTEDYIELADVGDQVDGFETVERTAGEPRRWFRAITLITRAPSGQHYRWRYDEGLTENQDNEGPAENGEPTITPVRAVEETVVVTKWVRDA